MVKTSRQAIISTAEALIQSTGHSEISLHQLSQQLGITHGALYKHFANKQALWEAVAADWFQREIIGQVSIIPTNDSHQDLHDWLWAFVNAKKNAFNNNPQMFTLNTNYIDQNPDALRRVLQPAYDEINHLLKRANDNHQHAEMILATFSIFTLPIFKDTWNQPAYHTNFEAIWRLIEAGV